MNFEEGLRLAYQTVKTNKLRTFLTTLGIVIGVTAVIGMMSIINALEQSVTRSLSAVGGQVFWVQKFPAVQTGPLDKKYWNRKNLTIEEAQMIDKLALDVEAVSPEYNIWGIQMKYRDKETNPNVLLYGGDENWAEVNGRIIREGRLFTKDDIYHKRYVVVLGMDIVDKLFPFTYPIGKEMKFGNAKFEVIGVIEEQGEIFGSSQDNLAAIPYTTFTKVFGEKRNFNIGVKAKSVEQIPEAMDQTTAALRIARKVPPGEENDFEIITQDSIMETLKNLTGFVFVAAVIICGISLIVGGIGIMNIMLVSVTERTREIGIRKAVGAKRKHILNQFLIEAIGICLMGGIIGVIFGVAVGMIISSVMDLPLVIPLWSVILGISFSLLIGIIFGVYPAMKAAQLNPIEALRYE